MKYKRIKYTYPKHCYACGKVHNRRHDLLMSVTNFKTFCRGSQTCQRNQTNLVELDIKPVFDEIGKVYQEDFARELRSTAMTKAYSFRPSMDMVYYMMQVSKKYRLHSWNEVIKHIMEQSMKVHPMRINIEESPFPTKSRSSYNDLVDNPFAMPDSPETESKSETVEPIPWEPKPEPEPIEVEEIPEPEPETVEGEEDEDIFTL